MQDKEVNGVKVAKGVKMDIFIKADMSMKIKYIGKYEN